MGRIGCIRILPVNVAFVMVTVTESLDVNEPLVVPLHVVRFTPFVEDFIPDIKLNGIFSVETKAHPFLLCLEILF